MFLKRLLISIFAVCSLGVMIFSGPVFATGEDEADSSEQSEAIDDETTDPTDDPATGDENDDTDDQPSKPSSPDQSNPSVDGSISVPSVSDSENEVVQPSVTPSSKPASGSQATATATRKPTPSQSNTQETSETPDEMPQETPSTSVDDTAPVLTVDTPRTGVLDEELAAPANPLTIILLIISAVTILAAGIFVGMLDRVAK